MQSESIETQYKINPTSKENSTLSNRYRLEHNLPENFPAIIIADKNNPSDGMYFLNSRLTDAKFMICVDTSGTPVFFREMNTTGGDLRLHTNGYLIQFEQENSSFVQYDSAYNKMRTYEAVGGKITDSHDFIVEEDGSYWLITKEIHAVDMSLIVAGGNPLAYVVENVIQHIDNSNNLLFEWNSLDHIDILDCDTNFVDLTGNYIDYMHANAIDIDLDGNLLISSRHLNEITKVDITTGNIIWRWGGNKNQFTFINDNTGFSGQHSIRSHEDGTYTLFDNGNWHTPKHSRGLEYSIDENQMTATLLNIYEAGDSLSYSSSMGHMQRTYDGGTIIGMAANNQGFVLSDFNNSGDRALNIMNFDNTLYSYRAAKYQWETNVFYFINDTLDFFFSSVIGNQIISTTEIYNNSDQVVELSGYHTDNSIFSVIDNFPIEISPQSSKEISISFTPVFSTNYTDALTIYSNSNSDSLRIAAQIRLNAYFTTSLMNKTTKNIDVIIKPNPLSTQSIITLSDKSQISSFRLLDISGKSIKAMNNVNQTSVILNRLDLPTGLIFIEIQSESKKIVGKIFVE